MKVGAVSLGHAAIESHDGEKRIGYFKNRPVEEMSFYMLRESICSHKACAECLLCEYGKEWVKRGYPQLDSPEYREFYWEFVKRNNIRDQARREAEALEFVRGKARQKAAEELRGKLKKYGISHRELADATGYSKNTIDAFVAQGLSKTAQKTVDEALEKIIRRKT